jgi:hypothetical protein
VREFVVTLRNGTRYTVKADRVRLEHPYLALLADRVGFDAEVVAMFDGQYVVAVLDRGQLASEEKGEPVRPDHFSGDRGDDIPF